MKAFICKILHSDIAYAGGKFVRCRTCRREWIAVHHVEPPRAMVDQRRDVAELQRIWDAGSDS